MLNHSSAKQYEETSHINKSTKNKTLHLNGSPKKTISNALKRHARSLIKDKSIDAQSRALIRYGLLTNDPWLPELVRRADAGETIIDKRGLLATHALYEEGSSEKSQAIEMICRAGDEPLQN